RVEGVTNAGWLLFLTPLAAALGPALAAKLLGAALLAAAVLLTTAAAARLVGERTHPAIHLAAGLLVLSRFDVAYFSLAGMETGLIAGLLLFGLWLSHEDRRPYAAAGVSALAYAVRPEAGLVYPLAIAIGLTTGAVTAPAALRRLAAFAAAIAAITGARYVYFGELVPNTFFAKTGDLGGAVAALLLGGDGPGVNVPFPFAGPFVLLPLGFGLYAVHRRAKRAAAYAAAVVATGYLFAYYAEPDWTGLGRYFAPYLPVGVILLLAGGVWLEGMLRRPAGDDRRRGRVTLAVAAVIVAVGAIDILYQSSPSRLRTFPGYVMAGEALVEPARWMRANLPADALIATRRIGAAAFLGDRRVFDYSLGLTDRAVARRVRAAGKRFWSPADPGLADLWRDRRPDYLLEDSDVIDAIVAETGGSRDLFRIHGVAYRVVRSFPVGRRAEETLFGRRETEIAWTLAAAVRE
ncbi:MAG TPA: hypothetical protein VJJ77_02700, partial [Dongiaceae bacterium]|nr:hypothetical protein [Dongiaceae bacterium]